MRGKKDEGGNESRRKRAKRRDGKEMDENLRGRGKKNPPEILNSFT